MTIKTRTDRRRHRLAANHNDTIVAGRSDHGRKRLAGNDNETIVLDEFDTEAHRLAGNDNETVVEGASEDALDAENDELIETAGARRLKR